jgi:ribosome maturation factor RimP
MNFTESKLRELVKQQTVEEGLIFIDMHLAQHKGSALVRVFAGRLGGITVGECASLSRRLGLAIDNEMVFPGKYTLEVSSPGLDRPLKTESDFELRIGESIKLFYSDDDGNSQELTGKLESTGDGKIVIATDDGRVDVEIDKVSKGQIIL